MTMSNIKNITNRQFLTEQNDCRLYTDGSFDNWMGIFINIIKIIFGVYTIQYTCTSIP